MAIVREKSQILQLFHEQGWIAVHSIRDMDEIGEALSFLGMPAGTTLLVAAAAAHKAVDEMRILMGEFVSADLRDAEQSSSNTIRAVLAGIQVATPKPTSDNPIIPLEE